MACLILTKLLNAVFLPISISFKILKSPLLWSIVLSSVGILCCSRYMTYTFFHYCTWFDHYTLRKTDVGLRSIVLDENQARINETKQYLIAYNNSDVKSELTQLLQTGPNKDVIITVITVDRFKFVRKRKYRPFYLSQTVAKLLQEFNRYKQRKRRGTTPALNVGIVICSADLQPDTNAELTFLVQTTSLPVIYRYNGKQKILADDYFQREKDDYTFCLNQTYQMKNMEQPQPHPSRYVLVLEDDAPPIKHFFSFLEDIIRNRLDRNVYGHAGEGNLVNSKTNSMLYVKLFHPDVLLQFHTLDSERLPQLFSIGILFGLFFAWMFSSMVKIILPQNGCSMGFGVVLRFVVFFTAISFLIGRPNLVQNYQHFLAQYFGMVTLVPAPSCCTPSILFPQSAIPLVTEGLSQKMCSDGYPKDAALDDLRLKSNRSAWLVQPNLHMHIGQFSMVRRVDNESYRQFLGLQVFNDR